MTSWAEPLTVTVLGTSPPSELVTVKLAEWLPTDVGVYLMVKFTVLPAGKIKGKTNPVSTLKQPDELGVKLLTVRFPLPELPMVMVLR